MYIYTIYVGQLLKQTEDECKLNSNVRETEEKFKYKLPAVTARILHSADYTINENFKLHIISFLTMEY